jgi:hypothetical protein
LTTIRPINSTLTICICATNPHCNSSVPIYKVEPVNIIYIVPGWIEACSPIDSLLLSTLECFYSDLDCFSVLINEIKEAHIFNVEYPYWFDVDPLVYNSTLSRFPQNSSLLMIVKEMMIEQWNSSLSYNNFYESCAPSYCSYSEETGKNTIIAVIIILVSTIDGLIISLQLITPPLVKFVYYLLRIIFNRKQQEEQPQGNH